MIDTNGEVKIIDFGSCYIKGIAEIATPLEREGVLGTAGYSAPEVVINGNSTIQSEVFSLAVIVYEMLTDDIEVTYPFGGEGFVPYELETIRWDTYGNTGSFTIDYSSDNGLNWNTITTSVPGYRRYYTWSVPNVVTGKALIRVSRGLQSNISNESFTIIKVPQNITVDWACPDSCHLTWNSVQGATSYVIRMLGSMYMDSIGHSTSNNFIVENINPLEDFWFSVQALGPNNAIGRRAYAIVKNPGVWNCLLAVDAELVEIIGMTTSTLQNCQDYSSLNIAVKIKNNGLSNISNIPLYYQHNNGTVIPETFSGTITPGDSANYTFTSSVDISSVGSHEIKVWLNYGSDGNIYNDSNIVNVKLIAGTTLSPDATEDFQGFSLCNTSNYCELIICNLSNGWINPPNLEDDDIDWRTNNGSTPSTNTGPTYDHTLGNPAGKYIYIEASYCFENTAHLLSPCFDLTSATHPVMDFWYNMLGADMGSLHVDILTGTHWNLDIINPISYNQGALWLNKQIDLSAYNGQTINIRFRGISGPGYQSDIALDDISVIETSGIGINNNVQLSDILIYPNPGKGLFNLSINNLHDNWVDVSIYDLQGRVMYNEHIKNRSDHYFGSINLSGISSGIYFLKVQNDNIFHIKKIVVQ